jgi:hypothetical protein
MMFSARTLNQENQKMNVEHPTYPEDVQRRLDELDSLLCVAQVTIALEALGEEIGTTRLAHRFSSATHVTRDKSLELGTLNPAFIGLTEVQAKRKGLGMRLEHLQNLYASFCAAARDLVLELEASKRD